LTGLFFDLRFVQLCLGERSSAGAALSAVRYLAYSFYENLVQNLTSFSSFLFYLLGGECSLEACGHVGDEADGCVADFEFSCQEGFGGACHSYDSGAEGLEHPDLCRRLVSWAFSAGHHDI